MAELLKFELYRLKKSVLFWMILGLCVAGPILFSIMIRVLVNILVSGSELSIADLDLPKATIKWITWYAVSFFYERLPLVMAIFTPLFIGRDYKDGIIRNKIIGGHSRFEIFATALITQCSLVTLFSVVYFIFATIGVMISPFELNLNGGEMLFRALILIISLCSTTVLIVALSLSIKNRVIVLVITVLFVSTFNLWGSLATSYSYNRDMIDDYIELCEDTADDLSDLYGYDMSDEVPDKKDYFGVDYWIGHSIYVLTNAGMGDEFAGGISSSIFGNDIMPKYSNTINREKALSGSFIKMLFTSNYVSYYIDSDDIRDIDGVEVPVSTAELTYTIKSVVWASVYALGGFAIFRKKDLF